jgi:SAM-dependent MidA family methyltransferase
MSNPKLCEEIAQKIQATEQKRISFADYMNLALYHPEYGYYTTGAGKIGAGGDFATSPHLCPDFGEMLAEQFWQMWQILGCPVPFQLVEMGAGQGLIAGDVLGYLQQKYPDFFHVLDYIIIEKSPGMRRFQQQRLARFTGDAAKHLRWCSWAEIEPESIIGCCFSNELVDALPVHQFVISQGKLKEIYVTVSEIHGKLKFVEVVGELSTPKIAEYFAELELDLLGGKYPDGYRSEVNLAASIWLKEVAQRLKRGYLLTIDYGYQCDRYYAPSRHQGTLQCYYQHRYHDDPYILVGQQDITAHVNFTALERYGKQWGLENIAFTQQGLFLMALGLGDRIAAVSTTPGLDIATALQRREVLHQLIDPMGLGNFGVLLQSKGLTHQEIAQKLTGFTIPPLR